MKQNFAVPPNKSELSSMLRYIEKILNGINEAFYICDSDTFTVVAANSMGAEVLNTSHSKLVHSPLLESFPQFVVPESNNPVNLKSVFTLVTSKAKKKIILVQVKDQPTTYELCVDKVQLSQKQHYIICKLRDITARTTRKEETLRFIHSLGHELKQPLGLIRAYTYYIKKNLLKSQASLFQYPEKINQQVDILTSMLNNIVETTKLSTELLTLNKKNVELTELLKAVLTDIASAFPKRTIIFKPGKNSLVVLGDEIRLRQALLNVLMNAVKYSPDESHITVKVTKQNSSAHVTIKDLGIGIPPDQINLIFEPYFRSTHSKASGIKGLGLGLALVNEIIRLHKGTITVTSQLNKGSTFIIQLPLAQRLQ